ncbi:site-specific integrase [Gaoshiqia sediminis]|uniref:Site-specific integrase n=1 Tax=Gaoshiqia sediminis TaxID=2986998 RepID=A0AA41Y4X5_9BACT|nr:site-specific integrase [Gaoshiqia sediminis]MCW0483509.1 site-specific integrase [Gaoshiqia sediminis]
MVNVTYYIDKNNANKKGFSPIKANIAVTVKTAGKTTYKNISKTVDRVKVRHWNKKKQRVSPPRPDEPDNDHENINLRLDELQSDAKIYFKQCQQQDIEITPDLVRKYLNGDKMGRQANNPSLWEAYDLFLKAGQLEKAYNTTRNRKTIHTKLKEFEEKTGYKMTFENINLEFWDRLKEYILVDQNHGFNYLAAIADKFKAFMNWSHERKFHENLAFKKFSAPEKEISIISLNWEELQQLITFEFANNKLAKARDFFCFGCLTGLRYVDLVQLTKDNINDGMIRITTQKTNKEVIIPVFPGLQTIIDRYPEHYKLLPKFSNQKINEYIKKCCELAGIKALTEYKTFVKNVTVKEFRPKHELIGTHTARKTFISLAYERGLDIEMIKAITGITREKTLKRYLQISNHTKKEKLMAAFNTLGEIGKST